MIARDTNFLNTHVCINGVNNLLLLEMLYFWTWNIASFIKTKKGRTLVTYVTI